MRLNLRIDFDETKVPVSYANVQSGVANLSARRRRHPNKKVFRPKRGLLLVWASTEFRSDLNYGPDGVCCLVHGDDHALLIWSTRPRLEVISSCTKDQPAAPVVNFVLRHSVLDRERCRKTFFPFRSRLTSQRLKYRSRWKQECSTWPDERAGTDI